MRQTDPKIDKKLLIEGEADRRTDRATDRISFGGEIGAASSASTSASSAAAVASLPRSLANHLLKGNRDCDCRSACLRPRLRTFDIVRVVRDDRQGANEAAISLFG